MGKVQCKYKSVHAHLLLYTNKVAMMTAPHKESTLLPLAHLLVLVYCTKSDLRGSNPTFRISVATVARFSCHCFKSAI